MALKVLLALVPSGNNSPLFQIKNQGKWYPLTDSKVRYHLKLVLKKLGLDPNSLSFHSFRRLGASYVFNNYVRLQDIKNPMVPGPLIVSGGTSFKIHQVRLQ